MRASNRHDAQVFVVSHDEELLKALPDKRYLLPINLNRLGLPSTLAGNDLAENRLLITDALRNSNAHVVGYVSARWDERFPNWPPLAYLNPAIKRLEENAGEFLAPLAVRYRMRQIGDWVKAQDQLHPGMSTLITEVLDHFGMRFAGPQLTSIVMGNNFILPGEVARDFARYWQEAFEFVNSRYGLRMPFSYRCPLCGCENAEGVGRWMANRHAGFFYERVTALYFASRPELVPIRPVGETFEPVKSDALRRHFALHPSQLRPIHKVLHPFRECTHITAR